MRVILISANIARMNILPLPLGPALVAAACRKAGHSVVLLNLMFEGDTQAAIQDCVEGFRPEVIGISVRNKELCRKIVERGLAINFWCIIYPKWVDSELVELMARVGCREISLGFESGSDPMLASLNNRRWLSGPAGSGALRRHHCDGSASLKANL